MVLRVWGDERHGIRYQSGRADRGESQGTAGLGLPALTLVNRSEGTVGLVLKIS